MQAAAVMQPVWASLPQRASLPRSSSSSRAVLSVRCSSAAAGAGRPPLPTAPLLRLTAAAAGLVQRGAAAARAAAAEAARQTAEQDINAQIRASMKQMRMLALVAPFTAASGSTDTFMIITRAVASFIKLYLLLLFVRVLLSWFPTFQWWEQQPFSALRQVGGSAALQAAAAHPPRASHLTTISTHPHTHTLPALLSPAAGHRPLPEAVQRAGAAAAGLNRPHPALRLLHFAIPGWSSGCGG